MSRLCLTVTGLAAIVAGMSAPLLAAHPAPPRPDLPSCTADLLPRAEKAAIEEEYAQRTRADGRAAADAWLRAEARVLMARMERQRICTISAPDKAQAAPQTRAQAKKAPVGKDGKRCKRTRLENRNVANVGGGPMMMVLVPVCAD